MKQFVLVIAIVCIMAGLSLPALPQTGIKVEGVEQKHMLMTMPDGKGRVRIAAARIDKDWDSLVVHLGGDVHVEIWTTTKYPEHAMFLTADEIDYNEATGDISPRGHVRLTVQDAK